MALLDFFKPKNEAKSFSDIIDAEASRQSNVTTNDKSAAALMSAYTKALSRNDDDAMDTIKDHYIVKSVTGLLIADVLETLPFKPILSLSSKNKTIKGALAALKENNDIDQIVTDILPQLLIDGNYHIRIEGNYIEDDVPTNKIVTTYKHQRPFNHLELTKNKLRKHPVTSYAHFGLKMGRIRIDTSSKTGARIIRHGTSIFADAIKEIVSLDLSDTVKNAATAAAASEGKLVGINVPATQKPADVLKIMNRYEQMLNKTKLSHDASGRLTAASIISRMGVTRVLPIFGDGKGQVTKVEGTNSQQDLTEMREGVRDQRKVVLSILGIPFELLYSYEGVTETSSMLKRYGRYVRLLQGIRQAVIEGIRQVASVYLAQNDIEHALEDISVAFSKPITDLSSLDRLEITASSLQSMRDMDEYLVQLMQDDTLSDFITNDLRAHMLAEGLTLMLGEQVAVPKTLSKAVPKPAAENLYPEAFDSELM